MTLIIKFDAYLERYSELTFSPIKSQEHLAPALHLGNETTDVAWLSRALLYCARHESKCNSSMCTTSDPVSKWSKALSISKRSARSESLRDIEIDMARLELDVLEHAGGRFRWEHLAVDEFNELLNILLVGLQQAERHFSIENQETDRAGSPRVRAQGDV